MRVKEGFVTREIAGEYIVVPTGEMTLAFNGLITLNETGHLLWQLLQEETDFERLVQAVTDQYDISEEDAEKDIQAFLDTLVQKKMLR